MNKPKAIGTKFETACVNLFLEAGFAARRLALSGGQDKGDVELIVNGAIYPAECKAHKNWTRGDVSTWREEALIEAKHYKREYGGNVHACLIVSQYRKTKLDSYVHLLHSDGWIQMYLDEFIEMLKASTEEG